MTMVVAHTLLLTITFFVLIHDDSHPQLVVWLPNVSASSKKRRNAFVSWKRQSKLGWMNYVARKKKRSG